jgi:hypothetical protein
MLVVQSIKRKFGLGRATGSQRDLTFTTQRPLRAKSGPSRKIVQGGCGRLTRVDLGSCRLTRAAQYVGTRNDRAETQRIRSLSDENAIKSTKLSCFLPAGTVASAEARP